MRNVFLTLSMCIPLCGFAQVFNVSSVDKVNIPVNPDAKVVAISPQGDYLLLSTAINTGLTKFDLTTSQTQVLTEAPGAGYDVKISPNGKRVIYRKNSFTKDHLKKVSLQSLELTNGKSKELVAPTRDLQGVRAEDATTAVVDNGKLAVKTADGSKVKMSTPVLSINNRQLMITRNGRTKLFSPNGKDNSYLWPSVSPDGTKVLYYVCGLGAYVCNIDGSNVKKIGMMRAPQWYNNDIVVGMNDQDNGEVIYASTIVAVNLKGETQTLTDGKQIAMYPKVSPATGKIVFSTPEGEVYIIHVTQ